MDCECNKAKPRYDISMSKRTRTRMPLVLDGNSTSSVTPITNDPIADILVEPNYQKSSLATAIQEEENGHAIYAKEKEKSGEANKGRNSLGQHFTEEEKQLQLVKKKQQGSEGAKLKSMVTRYAKVLSHLIKGKRDSHISGRKKPVMRLAN